jgi:hypothetical protein
MYVGKLYFTSEATNHGLSFKGITSDQSRSLWRMWGISILHQRLLVLIMDCHLRVSLQTSRGHYDQEYILAMTYVGKLYFTSEATNHGMSFKGITSGKQVVAAEFLSLLFDSLSCSYSYPGIMKSSVCISSCLSSLSLLPSLCGCISQSAETRIQSFRDY